MSRERSKTKAVVGGLVALVVLGCGICGPGPNPPPPTDTCSNPSMGNVTSVEHATPRLDSKRFATDSAQDDLPPRLLADNDVIWEIRGGQGASMVPVRLVFRGPDVPSCLAQDTQVMVSGQLGARNRDNVATYPQPDGSRATKTFWLPGAFSGSATITTSAAGKQPSINVRTASFEDCQGFGACPCARALQCCPDGLSDAGARLWSSYQQCLSTCDAGSSCGPDAGPCAAAAQACADDGF